MRSTAFCTAKAAKGTQDSLGETPTALDHCLKSLSATSAAISRRGRPEQDSMRPKDDLLASRFNSLAKRSYYLSLQMCLVLSFRNI